jgi:hypothetical protein
MSHFLVEARTVSAPHGFRRTLFVALFPSFQVFFLIFLGHLFTYRSSEDIMGNWQVHRDFSSGERQVWYGESTDRGRTGKDAGERERKGLHRTVWTGTKCPT